ncbi:hypothetical protein T4B_14698, partial [Trichinella pseudospiralis]
LVNRRNVRGAQKRLRRCNVNGFKSDNRDRSKKSLADFQARAATSYKNQAKRFPILSEHCHDLRIAHQFKITKSGEDFL